MTVKKHYNYMSYVYGNILQLIFFLNGIDKPWRIRDNS